MLAALGLVTAWMTAVDDMWLMFLLITLTRGLGQSMLSVASLTLVGKWFNARLALAMGVFSLLVGIGFGIAFKGVGELLLTYAWKSVWSAIGLVLSLVAAPLAWLLVRNGPDGSDENLHAELNVNASLPTVQSATVAQALATPAFWVFAVATSLYGLISSGIALFNESILNERGFAAETYHTLLAVSALVGMVANLLGGWAGLRWSLRGLLAAAMLAMALALVAFPLVRTLTHVYIYAVAMGASGGLVTVVFFSVWGQAYGPAHLGKIQGIAQLMTVVASAVGPLLLASCLERTGSYTPAFYALAPLAAALGLLACMFPLPSAAHGAWHRTA